MFADDIALLSYSPEGLQKQLDILQDFCGDFGLIVNMEKINQSINFYIRVPSLARLIGWHHEVKTQSTYVQTVDEESKEANHEHICGGGHDQLRYATPTSENPAQHRNQI